MTRWRNHFSQPLNVNDVRQPETHTAERLVSKPTTLQVQMSFKKLRRHKSSGIDQIPAEMINTGSRTLRSQIHELVNSIWNMEEFPEQWKESIIVPIYKGDKTG